MPSEPPEATLPPPLPAEDVTREQQLRQRRLLEGAFATWRGRLLDLTGRNRALNYKPTKVATLTIVDEKPAEVYRLLIGEEQALTFSAVLPSKQEPMEPAPEASPGDQTALPLGTPPSEAAAPESGEPEAAAETFTPYAREGMAERHLDTVLQCQATPESLDLSLRRIADLQRTAIEEQGVNTVFLGLGFLHYRESPTADKEVRAPLVLVPVTLERATANSGFRLLLAEDEPMVNPSLVEYLRRIHQIGSFPTIPEPADDATSVDLLPFFAAVAERVKDLKGWKVTEEIVLAPFTFQKLVIFKDIELNQEAFATHHLVRRVVLKEGEPSNGLPAEIRDLDLDADYPPEITSQVVDADSSQLRAIAAVAAGNDLVIHGPPGTGKSQTITNLIADAIGAGKRVLFVSEKMAALEVVHRRLVDAKLGEFCLELHSTKARKGDVIESLRTALDRSGDSTKGTVKSVAELTRARGHLNAYARDVHARQTTLCCTPFEAVGEFEKVRKAPKFTYPADPTALSPEQLADLNEKARQVEVQGGAVSPVGESGWRDSRIKAFSEPIAERIGKVLADAGRLATEFAGQARVVHQRYGVREPETIDGVGEIVEFALHLDLAPGTPAALLRDVRWTTAPPEVTALIEEGRQVSNLSSRLKERYRRELLGSVPADDLAYVEQKLGSALAFLAVLAPRYRDIRRRLKAMRRGPEALPLLEQISELKAVPAWERRSEALAAHPQAAGWFGAAWRGASSDWNDLERRLAWLAKFHSLAARHGQLGEVGYLLAEQGGQPEGAPEALAKTAVKLAEELALVHELLAWPSDYLAKATVSQCAARLAEVARDLGRGSTWSAYVRAVSCLANTPAAAIAEAAYHGEIQPEQAGAAFRRALYGAWLDKVLPSIPALADFSVETHEERRRQFQKLDSQLLTEKRGELVSRLRETGQRRYASSSAAHRSFLSKELAKQKRHRPLRVILREARDAVMALKPCYLMSPLSVSQFLAPKVDFDLVVFDEASQLPTEDAVAAISRGKSLVVVGDPKQLPPTNFFAIQGGASAVLVDDDGEPVLEETESVLEEFQGVGLHQAHLEWHYRSAHESLIQFSNEKFYGNRLVVFPSAATDSPDRGVHFEFVEGGQYVGAGQNPVEARRIAMAVIEHFRKSPELTLGVGTFSQRQQMAVWDELERIRRADPSLEEFFDRARSEPFFVKNLENIQGDERDVIFLSITYGKQPDGKLRYNFGPLNRENGWRRLNVLVSRARKQMRVFSSLRASDINPSSVVTQGPALLADFLRFAETGKMMAATTGTAADAESPFEHEVGEALEEMGFLVDRQVGVGAYRIDIGVRHRDRPGVYLAGLECDGASYHAAPCARDRDRLRQHVLEQRGWTIVRVWSTDWFRDRARTVERLKRTLDDLAEQFKEEAAKPVTSLAAGKVEEEEAPQVPMAAEPVAVLEAEELEPARLQVPPYRVATPSKQYRTSILEVSSTQVALEASQIVAAEGPIQHEELLSRLIGFWNHERRGARLVAHAETAVERAVRYGDVRRKDGFLYSTKNSISLRCRSGLNHGPEQVAIEELAEAARQIVELVGVMGEDDVATEVRRALGLRRTQDGMPRIKQAIQGLIEQGVLVYGVAGLRIRKPS
jgi:very-short-patch-repair endonuclease